MLVKNTFLHVQLDFEVENQNAAASCRSCSAPPTCKGQRSEERRTTEGMDGSAQRAETAPALLAEGRPSPADVGACPQQAYGSSRSYSSGQSLQDSTPDVSHATASESGDRPAGGEFTVKLGKRFNTALGLTVNWGDGSVLFVDSVVPGGLADRWNKGHRRSNIQPGCCIVEVNGVRGNSLQLMEEIGKACQLRLIVRRATPEETTRMSSQRQAMQSVDLQQAGDPRQA
mmetsp:Transcript_25792/g.47149  ORF Transcript_25792/g.47149 Transcript_25792/m.47149 type:complete len:229 (+) Transcript_25792:42-728(+)